MLTARHDDDDDIYICVCMCMCVLCIYIYICMCVCVCCIYIYIYIWGIGMYVFECNKLYKMLTHILTSKTFPYVQQICEDTRCSPEDLPVATNDREKWRERVRDIRVNGMT